MDSIYSVADLAKIIGAEIQGDAELKVEGVAPIATAGPGQLTYLIGGQYRQYLDETKASVVLLSSDDAPYCSSTKLVVKNPEVSFAKVAELFSTKPRQRMGVHKSAVVGVQCNIDATVSIGANCVIGDGVTIGSNSIVMPGVTIGDGVTVGENCLIYSNVTIYHQVTIGHHVVVHSGAIIGADGFGFAQEDGRWEKIPQIGSVVIEDNVDIGANTCIDRGALDDTIIRKGVKLDNLIQVGHNVEIGEHTIIAGCTAIAGSARIGKNCMIGGRCTISGHLTIADYVALSGTTTVVSSIEKAGAYSSGFAATPHRDWIKTILRLGKLNDLIKRVKNLERLNNGNHE